MARGELRLGRSQALGLIARVGIWAGSIAHRLPNHLNVVDDLNDACDPGNRFLGKLLEIEARHLASDEKPTTVILAPHPLKGQVWLTTNSLFR